MKEVNFISTLIPTHPDLSPIVQKMRGKYKLPEIGPNDDPITKKKGAPSQQESLRQPEITLAMPGRFSPVSLCNNGKGLFCS